jgi:hypothetical protein
MARIDPPITPTWRAYIARQRTRQFAAAAAVLGAVIIVILLFAGCADVRDYQASLGEPKIIPALMGGPGGQGNQGWGGDGNSTPSSGGHWWDGIGSWLCGGSCYPPETPSPMGTSPRASDDPAQNTNPQHGGCCSLSPSA